MTVSVKAPTSTTGSIQLNGSDVLTIDSSGNLTAPNNLTVTGTTTNTGAITSTGGIYLGGTASGNLLDDYEEGNYTPVLRGSTGNPTITGGSISGRYVKIGGLVFCYMQFHAFGYTGGSGIITLDAPFVANTKLTGGHGVAGYFAPLNGPTLANASTAHHFGCRIADNSSDVWFWSTQSGAADTYWTYANAGFGAYGSIAITYYTDS